MTEAGIYRNGLQHDGAFTNVKNVWIRSTKLSPQANFLWIYLLSHKIGYELRDTQILSETKFGRKGLRAARQELVDAGWLELRRKTNPDGSLGTYAYHLQEPRVPQGTVEQSTVEQGTVPERSDLRSTNSKKTINKKTIREGVLPPDWQPSGRLVDMFKTKWPDLDADYEIEQFQLYWWSTKKTKADWDLTFQRWMNDQQKKIVDRKSVRSYREDERSRARRELDEWLRKKEGSDDVD